ncbi:MAG: SAM-dependent methyltransferase [Euryarchaeota archaeon]|nr:SAM-dependent methyltransferase [Euryarchaeota archaeon]
MEEAREKMMEIFNRALLSEEPLSWFEELYSDSKRDREKIPWDWTEPHPFVVDWAKENRPVGKALVVGCGLGEDAAFLSSLGLEVTAFDISETAVAWAKQIHHESNIDWAVANLLELSDSWMGAFDLVLEVHIIQAIPKQIGELASNRLAPLVSDSGFLVCIGKLAETKEGPEGPPWPLSMEEIENIGKDLEKVEIHTSIIPGKESTRYRAVWKRSSNSS